MSKLFVSGIGAVSPAGWGVPALREALNKAEPLPARDVDRPGWERKLRLRQSPPPPGRPAFLGHARLRRASPVTQYGAAAAIEALSTLPEPLKSAPLGVVFCVQLGTVQYAARFFEEALKDPATASPMLFPETVFAAPASHIGAVLGPATLANTLLGDPAAFLQGLAMAAEWLEDGRVGACVVVGGEEMSWVCADAARHFDRQTVLANGAGALALTADPEVGLGVEVTAITGAHTYTEQVGPREACAAVRQQLPAGSDRDLLVDGLGGFRALDRAEAAVWANWPGKRLSVKRVLGEGLVAAAAWQCVVAVDAIAERQCSAATASVVGCNQQAIGAQFQRGRHTVIA